MRRSRNTDPGVNGRHDQSLPFPPPSTEWKTWSRNNIAAMFLLQPRNFPPLIACSGSIPPEEFRSVEMKSLWKITRKTYFPFPLLRIFSTNSRKQRDNFKLNIVISNGINLPSALKTKASRREGKCYNTT